VKFLAATTKSYGGWGKKSGGGFVGKEPGWICFNDYGRGYPLFLVLAEGRNFYFWLILAKKLRFQ